MICRVEEPTECCEGIADMPKKSGAVHICVDLTKLNMFVFKEKFILPSVEETIDWLEPEFLASWTQI